MGYRRKAREYALQMLYQDDIREFANNIVDGVIKNLSMIDEKIRLSGSHWSVDRMAVVDRNILRMAIFELLYIRDIPAKVTINEAIEIAKRYGVEESGSFVNGILDRVVKDHQEIIADKL